ncbi:MAG TPA: ABC transporter permease [Candidatus Lustribacter sp.]|jgi:molybdate transport system permease protein|nr:ABC transporter permease [Candidatus Lustribacter sp.]
MAVVVAAALLVAFIVVPLAGLFFHIEPGDLIAALQTGAARDALRLSIITTFCSLAITLLLGTPLAYILDRAEFPGRSFVDAVVDLPIVVPPAVAGLALLLAFGRNGTLGPLLGKVGIQLSFTTVAVIMAQTFVASPFYVRGARAGFAAVDRTLEAASATLGMGPLRTFAFITVPLAAPALIAGAVLSWARALGEFGATIMFAGNLQGVSQTLPLAVYLNLESGNLPVAVALSVILILFSLVVVLAVHVTSARRSL